MEQGVTINSFNFSINNSKQKPKFNKAKYFERNYLKHNFRKSSFNRTFVGTEGLIDDNLTHPKKHGKKQNNSENDNFTQAKQKLFENSTGNFTKRKWCKKKKQNHNIDHNSVQNKIFETSTVNSQRYRSCKKNLNNYVRSAEYHNNTHNNNIPTETTIIPKNLYFGNDSNRMSNDFTKTEALSNLKKANYRKKKSKKQKDKNCNTVNKFTLDNKMIVLNSSELNINKKQDSDLFYFDICGDKTHKTTPILASKGIENKLEFLKKSFNTESERKSNGKEIKDTNTVGHKQVLITNKTNVSHIVDANRVLKKQNSTNECIIDNSNDDNGLSSACDSTLNKKIKQKHRITKKRTEFKKGLRKDSSEVDILDCDTTSSLIYNKPTLKPATTCTELSKNKKKNKNSVKKFNKINNELVKIYGQKEITIEIDLGSSNTQQIYTVNEKGVNEGENIFHKKKKKHKRGHENFVDLEEDDCDVSKHSFQKNYVQDRSDSVELLENSGITKNTKNMQRVFKTPNKLKKKNEIKSRDMVNISESECEIIDFSSSKRKRKSKAKTLKNDIQTCVLEGSSNNTEDTFNSNEFDRMIVKSFKVKKKKSKHLQMEDNISHQLKQQNNCEEDIIDKHKNGRGLDSAINSEKYQCLDDASRYSKNHERDGDTLGNESESVTTLGLKNYEVLQDKEEKINEINKKNRKRDVDFQNECDIDLISSNKKRKFTANSESITNNKPKKKRRMETIKSNIGNPSDNSQIIVSESDEIPLIDELPKIKKKKHRTHQTESTILDYLEGREPLKEEIKNENEMDCVELNLAELFEDKHFGNEVLEEHNSILLETKTSTNDQSSNDSEIISSKWKSVKSKNCFTEIHENCINNLSIGNDALILSKSPNKCQIDNLNPKIEVTSDNVEEENQEFWSKSGHESTNGDKISHQETEEEDLELLQDKDASDNETKGEDNSETELSIIKSEDTKIIKSEEGWVRLDEIEKLQNLCITLNFAVPPLHALATRTTTPTKRQIKEIQNKNIPLKSGPFSKEEDEKMIENWKQLCDVYDVRMIPSLFIKFPSKMKMETKVNILRYIAHGLDDRLLHRVYIRFKHLLQKDRIKTGRFTSEEDEKILQFMAKTNSVHPFKDLSELLDRTSLSVEKRYELLIRTDHKISYWTPQMVDKFIKALMKIAKCEKLSKLKHREFTTREWKKLSKKLDNIPIRKLQRAWKITIYPRLFSKNVNLRDMKKEIIQILCDRDENDWRTVDWKNIAKQFKGFTADKIYMMFKHLIHFHVPRELRSDLKECLDFLQNKLLKYDRIPATHKFKKFVIKEGCITYDHEDSND